MITAAREGSSESPVRPCLEAVLGFATDVFGVDKPIIGVIHLMPLPGSPRWGGDVEEVLSGAERDARALRDAGFDGLIVENFGDAPFARDFAGRGAVAGMAAAGERVARAVELPLGVNVLRNDALSAVAVAAATGARFIRVNVHVGAAVCDQGIVQSDAMATMRAVRDMIPGLRVLADVGVKHAARLGDGDMEEEARDAVGRGLASGLIVTGRATGSPTSPEDVEKVRSAVPGTDVLVGSGARLESVHEILMGCDGIIVGSAVMEGGRPGGPIEAARAKALVAAARA